MLGLFLKILWFCARTPLSPILKIHRLYRQLWFFGANFSGCIYYLIVGIGFSFIYWLLGRLFSTGTQYRICNTTSGQVSGAERSRGSRSGSLDNVPDVPIEQYTHRQLDEGLSMGNQLDHAEGEGEGPAVSFSQLQKEDTQSYNREFGAALREHNTGAEISAHISASCLNGDGSCETSLSSTEPGQSTLRLRLFVSRTSESAESEANSDGSVSPVAVDSVSCNSRSSRSGLTPDQLFDYQVEPLHTVEQMDSMKDSGFDESTDISSDSRRSLASVPGESRSSSGGDSHDNHLSEHFAYENPAFIDSTNSLRGAQPSSGAEKQIVASNVESRDSKQIVASNVESRDSRQTIASNIESIDSSGNVAVSAVSNVAHNSCDSSAGAAIPTNMELCRPAIPTNVELCRPTTPTNMELCFHSSLSSTPVDTDEVSSVSTPCSGTSHTDGGSWSTAQEKRDQYKHTKLATDSSSLSSFTSLGSLSPSSSFQSIQNSFDALNFQEKYLKAYLAIEGGITAVNNDLEEYKLILNKLHDADTGEHCIDAKTIHKLSDMVSSADIADRSLTNKAFDIIRNNRTSGTEMNVPARTSSLPPTPMSNTSRRLDSVNYDISSSQSLENLSFPWSQDNMETTNNTPGVGQHFTSYVTTDNTASSSVTGSITRVAAGSVTRLTTDSITDTMASADCPMVVDIMEHVACEWKGTTPSANTIRQGYHSVVREHNYRQLVKIRGDNYCALRSTYCSMVLNGGSAGADKVFDQAIQKLQQLYKSEPCLVLSWNFANRMPNVTQDNKYATMVQCLQRFKHMTQTICRLASRDQQLRQLSLFLNTGCAEEVELLEAMKVMMLLNAIDLYKLFTEGRDVPVFVYGLFGRDTSETPCQLVVNHMNTMGDSGGLDQAEMCLLGHSLQLILEVFRLSQFGRTDFISSFPGDSACGCRIPLIAEDDRHYNTVLR